MCAYWLVVSTEWGYIPPMWGPMVDRLLPQLNIEGVYTYCNNDNMASLITGKCPNTVSELLQSPLNIIQSWWMTDDLSVNWTRRTCAIHEGEEDRRVHRACSTKQVWTSTRSVKYLGFRACETGLVTHTLIPSKTWGLKLMNMHRYYTAIIKSVLTYVAQQTCGGQELVWLHSGLNLVTCRSWCKYQWTYKHSPCSCSQGSVWFHPISFGGKSWGQGLNLQTQKFQFVVT